MEEQMEEETEAQLLEIQKIKGELLQIEHNQAKIERNQATIDNLSNEIRTLEMDGLSDNDTLKRILVESYQKEMSRACKQFNVNPNEGIKFLISEDLVSTPEEVAQFLYYEEELNKCKIGDYLGEKNDFNEAVLKSFVSLHDFTDLILVDGLRKFLWSFRLPGEAQKIDRMMECFAQRYCALNPGIFTNTDTCYVLSFSIIMLNTSLHNPAVKDKPTVEQFIGMNRGINDGIDLPRELLTSLYNSIKVEPFKFPGTKKEGWLWKQGGRWKTWKCRWFALKDNCLFYFEFMTDKEPLGIIPLENVEVHETKSSSQSKVNCFKISAIGNEVIKACKRDSNGRMVKGKHSSYLMSAETPKSRQDWIRSLKSSIPTNESLL